MCRDQRKDLDRSIMFHSTPAFTVGSEKVDVREWGSKLSVLFAIRYRTWSYAPVSYNRYTIGNLAVRVSI